MNSVRKSDEYERGVKNLYNLHNITRLILAMMEQRSGVRALTV